MYFSVMLRAFADLKRHSGICILSYMQILDEPSEVNEPKLVLLFKNLFCVRDSGYKFQDVPLVTIVQCLRHNQCG